MRSEGQSVRACLMASLAAACLLSAGAMAEDIPDAEASRPDAEETQVWILDEGQFSGVLITVQRIDPGPVDRPDNRLIHVEAEIPLELSMEGPWLVQPLVGHMPFTEDAFDATPMLLLAEGAERTDSFNQGYEIWQQRFATGQAGVWEVPIHTALEDTFGGMLGAPESSFDSDDLPVIEVRFDLDEKPPVPVSLS